MTVGVRPPPVSAAAAGGDVSQQESLAPVAPRESPDGVTLSELTDRAQQAVGEERAWLGTLINRALRALPKAADHDRQAALVLELLDEKTLDSLEDEHAVPCRAVAVEALLAVGYPLALQLTPDDLQYLREHSTLVRTPLPFGRIFGGFAGASAVTFLALTLPRLPPSSLRLLLTAPPELGLLASLVLTGLAGAWLALGRPWLLAARWVMGGASVASAAIVVADALAHRLSFNHLLLLLIPVIGLASAVLAKPPAPRTEAEPEPEPTLP